MFSVTYEIVTPESVEHGEADEIGFIVQETDLRTAIDLVRETRTAHCGGITAIECNEYPVRNPNWITVYNGMEFQTGTHESRSLHFPSSITAASRRRVARYLGANGA